MAPDSKGREAAGLDSRSNPTKQPELVSQRKCHRFKSSDAGDTLEEGLFHKQKCGTSLESADDVVVASPPRLY